MKPPKASATSLQQKDRPRGKSPSPGREGGRRERNDGLTPFPTPGGGVSLPFRPALPSEGCRFPWRGIQTNLGIHRWTSWSEWAS